MAKSPRAHRTPKTPPHEHLIESWLSLTCELLALGPGRISSDLDLASRVRTGFPIRSIEALIAHGIPDEEIFRSVISRRTFRRRQADNQKLTAEESDRAERFGRALALATLVLGDEVRAVRWLTQGKQKLKGQAPTEVLASGAGAKVVEELLLQSYFGFVA
jgi:putative toxin-antitoxin system antitoxin component (TIGR02293 family)